MLLFWSTVTATGKKNMYRAANYNEVNQDHCPNVSTFCPWNAIFSLCPAGSVIIPL